MISFDSKQPYSFPSFNSSPEKPADTLVKKQQEAEDEDDLDEEGIDALTIFLPGAGCIIV